MNPLHSDQHITKACTFTGQHNRERRGQTLGGIRTHDLSVQAIKAFASDRLYVCTDRQLVFQGISYFVTVFTDCIGLLFVRIRNILGTSWLVSDNGDRQKYSDFEEIQNIASKMNLRARYKKAKSKVV
jgi:hypothetical protein